MDTVTRINYKESIKTITERMINRPRVCQEPSKEDFCAICDAVEALKAWQEECPALNLRKHIAVLGYHVMQPRAILFKDFNTVAALKVGVQALEHALGKRTMFEEV